MRPFLAIPMVVIGLGIIAFELCAPPLKQIFQNLSNRRR